MDDVFDRSGPERLVAGGMWFFALMVLSGFFWLLCGVMVSRTYGPIGYGVFSTAQSLFNFIWAFVFGGLFEGLIRHGSGDLKERTSNLSYYFSTYLRYLMGMSCIVFISLFILSSQISSLTLRITVLSIAFSFLLSGMKDTLASLIGSLQRSDQLSIVNSSRSIIILVFVTVFITFRLPFVMLPVLILSATAGQLALSLYFLRPHLKSLFSFSIDYLLTGNKKFFLFEDIKQFSHIFAFGFFISIGKISFNVMKSLDIVILKMFFDYADVGIYSVADTASSILFYMTSFSLPVISAISEAHTRKDRELMEDYAKVAVKYPLLIGVPLTAIILAMARPIVVGVYGEAFGAAVVPLQILIVGTFLLMFGYNLSAILIGVGKSKLSGMIMAGAAVQYIVSLYVLVPILGFEGAALALTLTGLTSMFFVPYFLRKELRTGVFSGVPKVLISGVLMASFLFVLPKTNPFVIFLEVVVGVALFLFLLRLTGYITGEDIQMMKAAGRSFKIFKGKNKK